MSRSPNKRKLSLRNLALIQKALVASKLQKGTKSSIEVLKANKVKNHTFQSFFPQWLEERNDFRQMTVQKASFNVEKICKAHFRSLEELEVVTKWLRTI
jgi:hypothetical protein